MARQPYMGLGLLFPRLRGLRICGSSETSRLAALTVRAAKFCLRNISIHVRKVLLHAVNLRHGTDGFTSPPKEVVLRIFIT
jgi:hypothetical protein